MAKLNMLATTLVGTVLLAGGALAQGAQTTTPQSGAPTQLTKPNSTLEAIKNAPPEKMEKAPIGTSSDDRGDAGSTAKGEADIKTGSQTTMPGTSDNQLTAELVGKDVRNLKGEKIGEVERIDGNQAVVSVGGFLGIGERRVAMNASELSVAGSGADASVITTLSEDELEARPKVDAE